MVRMMGPDGEPEETPPPALGEGPIEDYFHELKDAGHMIDSCVESKGVSWISDITERVADGSVALLVHRKTEAEEDYWVRYHPDPDVNLSKPRGTRYEERRWDAKDPGDPQKQLVLQFEPGQGVSPTLVKRGFDNKDIDWINEKIGAVDDALVRKARDAEPRTVIDEEG